MYKLLYKLYFFQFNSKKIDNWHTRIIVRIFNHLLPFYFHLTKNRKSNRLAQNIKNDHEKEMFIVSLTTFPARTDKLWLTIETILRQSTKPDRLILWLYEGEFDGKSSLPSKLLAQEKRGLEIRFVKENLMPHKKYFYAMQEFPNANIITIDDDFIYAPEMLSKLIWYHELYPKNICCILTRKIKIIDNKVLPYNQWGYLKVNTMPKYNNLTMGGGGTLFPPNSLHKDAFDKDDLKELALTADDLWLKIMSLKNNTKVVSLGGEYFRFFVPIIVKDNQTLMDSNIEGGNNDIVFKKLLEYYQIPLSKLKD